MRNSCIKKIGEFADFTNYASAEVYSFQVLSNLQKNICIYIFIAALPKSILLFPRKSENEMTFR